MMFVYHYVIIPFHPQYLPKHAPSNIAKWREPRWREWWPKTIHFPLLAWTYLDRLIDQHILKNTHNKREEPVPLLFLVETQPIQQCEEGRHHADHRTEQISDVLHPMRPILHITARLEIHLSAMFHRLTFKKWHIPINIGNVLWGSKYNNFRTILLPHGPYLDPPFNL